MCTVFYLLHLTSIHNFELIIVYSFLKGIPSDPSKPGATPAWHALSNNRKAAHQALVGLEVCRASGTRLYST